MDAAARRAMAYAVACLSTGTTPDRIYDCTTHRPAGFSGRVRDLSVDMYDYDSDCAVTATMDGDRLTIQHYATGTRVDLDRDSAGRFTGHDGDPTRPFAVEVVGRSVHVVHDHSGADYRYIF